MKIHQLNTTNYTAKQKTASKSQNTNFRTFGIKPLKFDTLDSVSFSARIPKLSVQERMTNYAIKFLNEIGLKEDQPLQITASSKHIPFLKVVTDEAYKKGSGRVSLKVVEPEIEALRKKYNITETFNYKKEAQKELEAEGALFIKFDDTNCPYKRSGLSNSETLKEIKSIYDKVPNKIKNIFKLNPEELFKTALDMHEGQPILIRGHREHFPEIIKLVDYLYGKNKSKLVDVSLTEAKEFNTSISYYKYAKDDLIGKFCQSSVNAEKECFEKDTALLVLRGGDPELYKEIDSKRIVEDSKPFNEAVQEYYSKSTNNNPWLVYYAPTTKSALFAYPEYGNDKVAALKHALKDAKKINRIGKLKEHIAAIELRAKKMNDLLDKGFRNIRYVSVNPKTKLPDGKTDLKIGLSPKSFFNTGRMNMENTGHKPIVNIPTEEIFTSPKANTAEGVVSATMPLVLSSKIVEGIQMTFKKGKAILVKASKNEELLKEHIKANKNADKLGEVAIVADSPIFKLNRLFYSTLLDENAACHIAIGDSYADAIKGPGSIKTAGNMQDYTEQQKYLKKLNINTSTTHNDFMIGGPNVYVYAENPKTGEQIQIIKDDKFLL